MMADESPMVPERQELSRETRERLKVAVLRRWQDPTGGEGELREALRQAALEARGTRMRAEELIVAFKALWDEMPALHGGGPNGSEARLRERVISMSIRAYYSD
jgi:hypothetical protein